MQHTWERASGGVAPVGGAHQGHGNQPLTPGGFRVPLLRRVAVPGNAHCSPGARAPHRPPLAAGQGCAAAGSD